MIYQLNMKQWIRNIDGDEYVFLIGSHQSENQELIDNSKNSDIWFHVANVPSCHVICQLDDIVIKDKKHLKKVIKQGALCCKIHSKFANVKNLEITYCRVEDLTNTDVIATVIVKNGKSITI